MGEVTGAAQPDLRGSRTSGVDVVVRRVADLSGGDRMSGRVEVDPDRLLTGPEVAELLEIDPATWRGYVRRGLAPAADDPDEGRPANRRSPRWRLSTVRAYRQDPRRNPRMRRGVA